MLEVTGNRKRNWRRVAVAFVALAVIGGAVAYVVQARAAVTRLMEEGRVALDAREYVRARDLFDRYLAERPTDTAARLLAARAARQARAYRDAREHLRRCRDDGGDAEAIEVEHLLLDFVLGDAAPGPRLRSRTERDDEVAIAVLEVLIQHDLDTYQLGSAVDGFTRYLSLRPGDLHALLGRGFVRERFMNFADALTDYREAVATHPDNDRARLKLGETLLIVATPGEALEQFQWLSERWPDRPPVRLGLARCYRRLGRPGDAATLIDGLLRDYPDHAETLWERGELFQDQNNPVAAEPLLRKAATKRPFDRRVQYSLARCLLSLGRTTESEAFTARVRQLDTDLSRLNTLRDEVVRRPGDAALRCEGGLLFLRNGERDEGLRWLRMALELDPRCDAARAALVAENVVPKGPGARSNP